MKKRGRANMTSQTIQFTTDDLKTIIELNTTIQNFEKKIDTFQKTVDVLSIKVEKLTSGSEERKSKQYMWATIIAALIAAVGAVFSAFF